MWKKKKGKKETHRDEVQKVEQKVENVEFEHGRESWLVAIMHKRKRAGKKNREKRKTGNHFSL